jgi:putative endonuclease
MRARTTRARTTRAKDVLGRFGEDMAARHLTDSGAEILDRNWRCRDGELDIVARDGDILIFCEVKTRSGNRHGSPAEAVVTSKAARIRRLAARWLAVHPHRPGTIRFDLLAVYRGRSGPIRVEHRPGAF